MGNAMVLRLAMFGVILCSFNVAEAQVARQGVIDSVLTRGSELPTVQSRKGRGFLSSILRCAAPGDNQEVAAGLGGLAGGLLGNRVVGRGSRAVGTVVGAAVGAAVGSALGCRLQRREQAQAEAALTRSVETGEAQSWIEPSSGASGSTRVVDNRLQGLPGMTFAPGVLPASDYQVVDGYFAASSRANIRSAPRLDSSVLGQLALNERVWVPAAITSGDWLLVSTDGVGQGYVSSALLTREASIAADCKIVQQTISARGETEIQNLHACRNEAGGWTFTTN